MHLQIIIHKKKTCLISRWRSDVTVGGGDVLIAVMLYALQLKWHFMFGLCSIAASLGFFLYFFFWEGEDTPTTTNRYMNNNNKMNNNLGAVNIWMQPIVRHKKVILLVMYSYWSCQKHSRTNRAHQFDGQSGVSREKSDFKQTEQVVNIIIWRWIMNTATCKKINMCNTCAPRNHTQNHNFMNTKKKLCVSA